LSCGVHLQSKGALRSCAAWAGVAEAGCDTAPSGGAENVKQGSAQSLLALEKSLAFTFLSREWFILTNWKCLEDKGHS